MAAPAYESFATGEANEGTTVDVAAPSGSVEGDFWLAVIVNLDSSITVSETGWTEVLTDVTGAGTPWRLTVLRRYAPASPGTTTFDFTAAADAVAVIARVSGAHATAPIDASGSLADPDVGVFTTQTAPSVTTTVDDVLLFRVMVTNVEGVITARPTTSRWEVAGTGGGIQMSNLGSTAEQASAGASGTATWTTSGNARWAAATIAIAPAAGGGFDAATFPRGHFPDRYPHRFDVVPYRSRVPKRRWQQTPAGVYFPSAA